jgi:hypothetical protein
VQLLDTLVHELCHAVDDCFSGHGEDFKGIAQTVGLEGPARMAHATEELTVKLMMIKLELIIASMKNFILVGNTRLVFQLVRNGPNIL